MIKKSELKIIIDELFILISLAWILFMIMELVKVGLVSNYYNLNIHFLALILFFVANVIFRNK